MTIWTWFFVMKLFPHTIGGIYYSIRKVICFFLSDDIRYFSDCYSRWGRVNCVVPAMEMKIRTRLKKEKSLEMKIQIGEKINISISRKSRIGKRKLGKSNDAGDLRADWMKLSLSTVRFSLSIILFSIFVYLGDSITEKWEFNTF